MKTILKLLVGAGLLALAGSVLVDNYREKSHYETLLIGAYAEVTRNRINVLSEMVSPDFGRQRLKRLSKNGIALLQSHRLLPNYLSTQIAAYYDGILGDVAVLEMDTDDKNSSFALWRLSESVSSMKDALEIELTRLDIEQPIQGRTFNGGHTWQYALSYDPIVGKDKKETINGAKLGFPRHQTNYALKHQDPDKSIELLKDAASEMFPQALHVLGIRYLEGDGVEKSNSEAHKLLLSASTMGYATSMAVIALMYEAGSIPSERKDTSIAFEWMKKGAERGDLLAQLNMGRYYETGIGTQINHDEARQWYRTCTHVLTKKSPRILKKCESALEILTNKD